MLFRSKLLRVLQFGEIRPVGGEHTHHVDVRVIACTHRDLPTLVKDGRFREDLYFRLNVLPLHVPPLRDHKEDIPALATHFLAEALKRAPQSPVRSIHPAALRALTDEPWPGNVRQLASTVERAVVFGVHETIGPEDLALDPRGEPPQGADALTHAWPFPSDAPWTLQHLNRVYTDWVLAKTGGNKERAAEILGIDLSTLYRWQRSSLTNLRRRADEPTRAADEGAPGRGESAEPSDRSGPKVAVQ